MKQVTFIEIDVPEFTDTNAGNKTVVPGLEFDFETNSLLGWTASADGAVVASASGMIVSAIGDDPSYRSAAGLTIIGAIQRYVAIDIERLTVRTLGAWQGRLFYITAGHGESASFQKVIPEIENTAGFRETIVLDMYALSPGGTDWADNTITRIRLDFEDGQGSGGVTPDGTFKIHSIVVGERIETFRFSLPADYLPRDIEAIPSIEGTPNFTAATVSLGQDLGTRASLTVAFVDHRHIFDGEPFTQGSFWGKWRGRYGTRLRGRALRWITGLVGQDIADMETRHFYIDSTDGPTPQGKYSVTAKDLLKFADSERAQAPALSNGSLVGDITAVATTFTLTPAGIGNSEYPASGYVAIGGEEIVSFTRAADVMTIVRGQLGTVAAAHEAGDRAQIVLRYVGEDPADIIYDLLVNYAFVDATVLPLEAWQTETGSFLQRLYSANIAEPVAVKKLIEELVEQAALAIWWEPLTPELRLQVLRAIATNAEQFDQNNTMADTLSSQEQPNTRISQIWTYFGQRNPLEPIDQENNFRSTVLSLANQDQDYGSEAIKKIFSRWIPFGGRSIAVRLNEIQIARFKDPPRKFGLEMFRYGPENATLGGGYQLASHAFQDETGLEVTVPIQIVRLNVLPDRYRIEAEEMLFTDFTPDDLSDRVIIIDSNIQNVNMRDIHDSIYPEPTGVESPSITVTCIIEAGVGVGSVNTTLPAFDVGSWPSGINLVLEIRGRIQGAGGAGGNASTLNGDDGSPGGSALYTRENINVIDEDGEIWGGGGGGGGLYTTAGSGGSTIGGGGGQGDSGGANGTGEYQPATVATTEAPAPAKSITISGSTYRAGAGGVEGTVGDNAAGATSYKGVGGAGGIAVDGISFITQVGPTGDRQGTQVN